MIKLGQNLIILIGVLSSIVALNLIIGAMIIVFRRRERTKSRKRLLSASTASSARTESKERSMPDEFTSRQSYLQLVMNAKHQSQVRRDARNQRHHMSRSVPPPPILNRVPGRNNQRIQPTRTEHTTGKQQRAASNLSRATSVRSIDTASIYSATSAAPEFHELILNARTLDTIPASPASPLAFADLHIVEENNATSKPIISCINHYSNWRAPSRLSDISEDSIPDPLAPKVTWKAFSATRTITDDRQRSISSSSASPPLSPQLREHSRNTFYADPKVPPVSPLPSIYKPLIVTKRHPFAANNSPFASPGPPSTYFQPPALSSRTAHDDISKSLEVLRASDDGGAKAVSSEVTAIVPLLPPRSPLRNVGMAY